MTRLILADVAAALERYALAHAVLLLPILLASAFLVPAVSGRLRGFARSARGRIAMVCLMAVVVGWEARAAHDVFRDRPQHLQAELVAVTARAAAEAARADENARQVEAQRAVAAAAGGRERAAAASADTLQQQVQAYASELASKPARLPHHDGCRLSGDDARRLRGLGAAEPGR